MSTSSSDLPRLYLTGRLWNTILVPCSFFTVRKSRRSPFTPEFSTAYCLAKKAYATLHRKIRSINTAAMIGVVYSLFQTKKIRSSTGMTPSTTWDMKSSFTFLVLLFLPRMILFIGTSFQRFLYVDQTLKRNSVTSPSCIT